MRELFEFAVAFLWAYVAGLIICLPALVIIVLVGQCAGAVALLLTIVAMILWTRWWTAIVLFPFWVLERFGY